MLEDKKGVMERTVGVGEKGKECRLKTHGRRQE